MRSRLDNLIYINLQTEYVAIQFTCTLSKVKLKKYNFEKKHILIYSVFQSLTALNTGIIVSSKEYLLHLKANSQIFSQYQYSHFPLIPLFNLGKLLENSFSFAAVPWMEEGLRGPE